MSATFCINDGDTHNTPVEAGEGKGPILIAYRKLRQDSGGAGRFRGGLGVAQEVRIAFAGQRSVRDGTDRSARLGDCTATKMRLANRFSVLRNDGSVQRVMTGKTIGHVMLER